MTGSFSTVSFTSASFTQGLARVIHSITLKYGVAGKVFRPNTLKYVIIGFIRILHPAILKYTLRGRILHSNTLRYNVTGFQDLVHTRGLLYQSPQRPRIRIYAFTDNTYASPLYTYDAFTDAGNTTKPISLRFESSTTTAGSFEIQIEDSDGLLDQETFIKGNRIFIEMSKDGSTWQAAFKGVVRSCERFVYGAKGSTFTISGYSYLVRFNERVINVLRESGLVNGLYNRADSSMFTNNLINSILTVDADYVYALDDTAQYSLFKTDNLASSPVTAWIPRLDAQLTQVTQAINSILDFSNGILTMDPSNDQLVLFDPEQVTTGTGVFLITDQPNLAADNGSYTMYPTSPYKYNIAYDTPDSASRLIASIGNVGACIQPSPLEAPWTGWQAFNQLGPPVANGYAVQIIGTSTSLATATIGLGTKGNVNSLATHNHVNVRFAPYSATSPYIANYLSNSLPMYYHGDPTKNFPSQGSAFWVGFSITQTGFPTLTQGDRYWMTVLPAAALPANSGPPNNNSLGWVWDQATGSVVGTALFAFTGNSGSTWTVHGSDLESKPLRFDYAAPSTDPCGGIPSMRDAVPLFETAEDKNMSKRIGMVERVMSDLPISIRTPQTMDEFLFAQLYQRAKPRFTFDFSSVTIPNTIPKAGDVVAHALKTANVGTRASPVQTGVILSVNYEFAQEADGMILTKMGLLTTGVRRGFY